MYSFSLWIYIRGGHCESILISWQRRFLGGSQQPLFWWCFDSLIETILAIDKILHPNVPLFSFLLLFLYFFHIKTVFIRLVSHKLKLCYTS